MHISLFVMSHVDRFSQTSQSVASSQAWEDVSFIIQDGEMEVRKQLQGLFLHNLHKQNILRMAKYL